MRFAVPVVICALVLVPAAAGQETAVPRLTWEGEEGAGVVRPQQVTLYEATLHVACREASLLSTEPWVINVKAEPRDDVSGFAVSWSPATMQVQVDPVQCVTGEELLARDVRFNLSVAASVPAEQDLAFDMVAWESSAGEEARRTVAATVAHHIHYQARFEKSIFKVTPGETVGLDLFVANWGNAPIRVVPSVAANSAAVLEAEWADNMRVDPGEEDTFDVGVETSGAKRVYDNRRDTFILDIDVVSIGSNPVSGEPTRVTAVIQQQGSSATEAPGLNAVFALAVVALGLFVAARHRGRSL